MPRKKRRMLLIVSAVMVVIIIAIILIMLYITTDMFKSNQTLFAKYMGKNVENVTTITKALQNDEYNEMIEQNKITNNTEIKINYTENKGTSSESRQNNINQLKITLAGQIDKQNQYEYQDIHLLNQEESIAQVEYMKQEETYGLKFTDLFKQYIVVENLNLKELLKKIGYTEEELEKVPNQIQLSTKLTDLISFSELEKESLKAKYNSILAEGLADNNFTKQSNVVIDINHQNIKTNVYTLTLTKEQLNHKYISLLEVFREDEVILGKLDQVQEQINQYQFLTKKETDLRNTVVTEINTIIEEINKNNIGQEECKIMVYESNSETVRTSIQGVEYEVNLDCLTTLEGDFVQFSKRITSSEIENSEIYTLKKENQKIICNVNLAKGNKITEFESVQIDTVEENKGQRTINAILEEGENKVEANIEQEITVVNEWKEQKEWNEENSIRLDELTEEQVKAILNRVKEGIENKTNSLLEEKIKKEDLIKVLKVVGIIKEDNTIEGNGITETEKNRFNSQFELLKGNKLKGEKIIQLIEATKNNLVNMEVVSNTELKLELNRNEGKEEIANTLIEFMKKNENKEYNIDIEYNQETGLANYIVLKIEKEK